MTDDTVTLGGNIELTGFSALDGASMIVIKKLVGTYGRKFSDGVQGFEKLSIKSEKTDKYAITATLSAAGQEFAGQAVAENLFFALDSALKDLQGKALQS